MPFPKVRNPYKTAVCYKMYETVVEPKKNGKCITKIVDVESTDPLPSADLFDLTAIIESGNDAALKPLNTVLCGATVHADIIEDKNGGENNTPATN